MASFYPRSFLVGLIGAPISHSASPAMHEAAGRALGFRYAYHLVEVAGADQARLRVMLEGVRALNFTGVNVTFPYKIEVLPLLDELAPSASQVGAVNTISVREGRLIGFNTDSSGFARGCRRVIGDVAGQTIALIGAGGVGKAIGVALADSRVARLNIVDREAPKARELAEALALRCETRAYAIAAEALPEAHGLVNATAVGMLPSRDSPVASDLLRSDLWVADAVYQPLWTPLLLAAREKGARVMTGRELAIDQAVDAFAIFTGVEPPRAPMEEAFERVIAARGA
jgi:quinate/shikimate dehydrogenase (NAD+)